MTMVCDNKALLTYLQELTQHKRLGLYSTPPPTIFAMSTVALRLILTTATIFREQRPFCFRPRKLPAGDHGGDNALHRIQILWRIEILSSKLNTRGVPYPVLADVAQEAFQFCVVTDVGDLVGGLHALRAAHVEQMVV